MPLDPANNWKEAIEKLKADNKSVEVHLKSGASFKGKIDAISDHSVLLTELANQSLNDALVRFEFIEALVVKR